MRQHRWRKRGRRECPETTSTNGNISDDPERVIRDLDVSRGALPDVVGSYETPLTHSRGGASDVKCDSTPDVEESAEHREVPGAG